MSKYDDLKQENEVLRERIARLTEASLRVNTSLDLNTVLREVVRSALALTDAHICVIVTIDENGRPEDFVTSGLSTDELETIETWANGPKLFEYLSDLPTPLRVENIAAYVEERGFTDHPLPDVMVQCTPMRHRGAHIGNFYLARLQSDQAFKDEDEDILIQFSAQAAIAIANARSFRKEQRTRADLEALIEISPVGVVVFNAVTGKPDQFNREAIRIGDALRRPDQSIEQLLEEITYRRGDGTEYSLKEFQLAHFLARADRVRSEEVVLSVPNGRKVTLLVSAIPIPSSDDSVASLVATVQDLGPIEEIERMRAQFVSSVSQELRAPLMSIQGAAVALLDPSASVPSGEAREYISLINEQVVKLRGLISDLLDAGHIEAGTLTVSPEISDVADLIEQVQESFASSNDPHPVHTDISADVPLVMIERRRIAQVLDKLLVNAARHSSSSSPIRITTKRDGFFVAISVQDQGSGLSPEHLQQVFRKQTRDTDSQPHRSSGLDLSICKGLVEAHGGRIWVESGGIGHGTRFTFTLPIVDHSAQVGIALSNGLNESNNVSAKMPILVVDENASNQRYIRDVLKRSGFRPIMTADQKDLRNLLRTENPQLILLDLVSVSPGVDGDDVTRRIVELAEVPVICMCTYGSDRVIASAMQAGVADYIVKPFTPAELNARIQTVLRKRSEPEPLTLGELDIDFARRQVRLTGRVLELTVTEYDLLRELASNSGRLLSFDSLIRTVWHGRGSRRLVRVYINRLRTKLGDDPKKPSYIVNERGVGYRIKQPAED